MRMVSTAMGNYSLQVVRAAMGVRCCCALMASRLPFLFVGSELVQCESSSLSFCLEPLLEGAVAFA